MDRQIYPFMLQKNKLKQCLAERRKLLLNDNLLFLLFL